MDFLSFGTGRLKWPKKPLSTCSAVWYQPSPQHRLAVLPSVPAVVSCLSVLPGAYLSLLGTVCSCLCPWPLVLRIDFWQRLGYSWFCTQASLLVGTRDHMGCGRSKSAWLCAHQNVCLLAIILAPFSLFSFFTFFFLILPNILLSHFKTLFVIKLLKFHLVCNLLEKMIKFH